MSKQISSNIKLKKSFLSLQRKSLLFVGHDIFKEFSGKLQSFWMYLQYGIVCCLYIPDITFYYYNFGNIAFLTQLIGPFISMSLTIWKMLFLIIYRKNFNEIIKDLKDLWLESIELKI